MSGRGPGPGAGGVAPGQKAMDFTGTIKRLLGELRGHGLLVASVLVFGAVSVVLTVLGPKLLGNATNIVVAGLLSRNLPEGLNEEQALALLRDQGQDSYADILSTVDFTPGAGLDTAALATTLGTALAVYVGAWLLGWQQARLTAIVVQRTMYNLRGRVEDKLHRVPLSFYDRSSRGDVLSRVTNDIDNVSQVLNMTLSQLVVSVFTVVGVLGMMFAISPVLATIAVVTVPLSGVVTVLIAKRAQPQFIAQWRTTGELNGHVEESYTGHDLVRVFGQEEEMRQTFRVRNEEMYEATFRANYISGTIQPVMGLISNLSYVAVAVVGGLRVLAGQLSIGDVQAVIQYSRQFTQPISQIASMMTQLQSGAASAERIYGILDAHEEEAERGTAPSQVRGEVAFEGVSFSYDPSVDLIRHLDLRATPGETVAIVGPTGAGKTTLVNLLMRFYDVDAGRITLDGVDIREMPRDALRSQIGMVLQDTWLFEGTIAQNILYPILPEPGAEPTAQQTELMKRAARATRVEEFVRSLPEGFDTVVSGESGALSQGERQLLTIARAFVADPSILILDEATSSVDTRTEVLVQEAMNALRVGRTSFVIAHRLSTITGADTIVVMEHGQIVEQGSHRALLEADGAYARLYASQFAAAATEDEV
ncbi:ABC transporter ATP-binding protein [Serinibacter salmoneus]|uniref:Fatty acid ABC transporter ATP-binding/permease protein n=1 Tax=Serinibacter salmoneus TaxID=556530 RepID=A0A2A9D1H9_9MICO|nr:ABC transporter ATP-binding protein [Serinibacter salmoneus]PFG19802.1 ATP-binding cassette subfamily B protein [Serinibacter salmoneus]